MKKIKTYNWFHKIPRNFFQFPILIYVLYEGVGYFIVGILHSIIWMHGNQVETVFTNLNINIKRPSPIFALLLFFVTGFISSIFYYFLFRKIRREGGILELVFWGTFISLIFSFIPWLYASSIASTIFLFLYGMISISGFGLIYRLHNTINNDKTLPDYWKMFVNATKACAAIIAVLLGATATSVLLPWKKTIVEESELLRYAFLCFYVIIGMLAFVIIPLLAKSLENNPIDDVELNPPGPL